MPKCLLTCIAWIGIFLLALSLRLHDLAERPMHADEATGARILSHRLEDKNYNFDPTHFHGPLLSLSSVPLAEIRNESKWSELTKLTLRLQPVIAGTLLILTPLLWVRRIGSPAALASAALLATSPLLIYYSRMYIHESLLALFAMLACAGVFSLAEKPKLRTAILAGVLIGLMYATKETFVITVFCWLIALAAYFAERKLHSASDGTKLTIRPYVFPALIVGLSAALTAGFFYSEGFKSFQGVADAVRTYFVYTTTDGHVKGFGYYLHNLIWPKHGLNIWWTEAGIVLPGLLALSLKSIRARHLNALVFLAIATVAQFIVYSFISYKTPWLMLVPWAHACLLAGFCFSSIHESNQPTRIALYTLLIACLGYQTYQSIHANGRFANDLRNPYAYVPTSKDTEALESWLSTLSSAQALDLEKPIAVVGREYWPLPWYLRKFETIGYWPKPISEIQTYPMVFAMPEQTNPTGSLLNETHTPLPRGLRANVGITLYLRNDIWNHWTKQTEE